MKKLLYQLDTDPLPSVFDNVVAYDGGADQVGAYGGVCAANVAALVEGAIFTRGLGDKKNTAIFVGGSNLPAGEALLAAVTAKFFAKFRVSVMFDCNGSNTTAAAAVALLSQALPLAGKQIVLLGGSGPVGQRAAVLLAREKARVRMVGRRLDVVQPLCAALAARFGCEIEALAAATEVERNATLTGAHVVLATGASGVRLLEQKVWADSGTLQAIADANASPPAGIDGVGMNDRSRSQHGKLLFGPLAIGALKLAVHRACIERLFARNDEVLDIAEIYAVAKAMTAA